MAHVWNIIDGDIYVSKNGDDVTGDGTMANPYASINKATTVGVAGNKIVIGTGLWKEARGTSTNTYHFVGDEETIIDTFYFSTDVLDNFSYLKFIDSGYNTVWLKTTLAFSFNYCVFNAVRLSPYDIVYSNKVFNFCLIDSCNFVNGGATDYGRYYFKNCTVIKLIAPLTACGYSIVISSAYNTIFKDCAFSQPFQVWQYTDYCVIDNCTLYYHNYDTPAPLTSAITESNGFFTNSLFVSPKFNNSEIGDYTLQPDSPCLFSGTNNSTIGAFGLGYSFDANSSEFTEEGGAVFSQTAAVNDIIRTQQTINGVTQFLFQLASGHAFGDVESAWIDLQTIRYLLITRLFANIIYNAAGVATSRPDNLETAGEKAVFYDFELKYCNEESEKATAAWKNVIWNKAVTIDNTGRGNADPAFVANEAQYISARFIKIKLYMTEA